MIEKSAKSKAHEVAHELAMVAAQTYNNPSAKIYNEEYLEVFEAVYSKLINPNKRIAELQSRLDTIHKLTQSIPEGSDDIDALDDLLNRIDTLAGMQG